MAIPILAPLLNGTTGTIYSASDMSLDGSGFTGRLAGLSPLTAQAMADRLDNLQPGATNITQQLLAGNILQTTFTYPAPLSPVTLNTDLSSLGGGGGTVDVSGTPTANQIATWVDADTLQGVDRLNVNQVAFATTAVAAAQITDIRTQAEYEARRNTEAITTITTTSATVYRLPTLGVRAGWYRTGDIFIYTNSSSSTRSVALQVGTAGDRIPGSDTTQNGNTLNIDPGESVAVRLPATGRVWERVAYTSTIAGNNDVSGSGSSMVQGATPNPFLPITPWNYDLNNFLKHRGNVEVGETFELAQDNLRGHISASSQSNNEVSVTFADDAAMVLWWGDILPDQEELQLGSTAQAVQDALDSEAPQSWIETNIGTSYNFELINRDSELTLTSTSLESSADNTVRIGLSGNVNPFYMGVGHYVRISGSSDSRLNGDWEITQALTTHIVVRIPGVTTTDIGGTPGGTVNQLWYASTTPSINAAGRVFPFYLFSEPTRTTTSTGDIASHQFDHTSTSGNTEFDVMFNFPTHIPSVLRTVGNIVTEDSEGLAYGVGAGSKFPVTVIDNITTVTYRHYIGLTDRYTYIKTSSAIEIYLDLDPATLSDGEIRYYTIAVAEGASQFSGYGFYAMGLGNENNLRQFDNGLGAIYIPPAGHVDLMAYNDGVNSGVRIMTPIQRSREQLLAYQVDTTLTLPIIDRLPISHSNRNQQNDEDPIGFLIRWGGSQSVPANTVRALANGEYTFNYELTLKFNGAEGTGLLFVPVNLTPYVGNTAISQHRVTGTLLFSRNGQTGANAPKYELSMKSNFRYLASANDDFHWRLSFGVFPTGYSISDIQIFNAGADVTAQLNLK